MCLVFVLAWASSRALAGPQSFSEFLQEYNAIEVLDQELEHRPPSPDMILKRARLHLQMGKGDRALSLLQAHGSFSNPEEEAQRLWTKAQALRLQLDHVQALVHFSQAARLMGDRAMQAAFANEPELQTYWQNVSTMWIWTTGGSRYLADSGQTMIMIQALSQAQRVWPDNPFWKTATGFLSRAPEDQDTERMSAGFPQLRIQDQTRFSIAQCLAAVSLGQSSRVPDYLETISQPEVRKVWALICKSLTAGPENDPDLKGLRAYPKMAGLQEMVLNRLTGHGPQGWAVSVPSTSAWKGFQEELAVLPVQEALSKTFQELSSSLLSPDSKQALVSMALSYAILAQDREAAQKIWDTHHSTIKPLSLRLAANILGLSSRLDCLKEDPVAPCPVTLLSTLASAAGVLPPESLKLPFWIKNTDPQDLVQLASRYPLDLLLNYAADRQRWSEKQTPELARTIGLLFPGSALANQGLFFLAQRAHKESNSQLAWQYLQKIQPEILTQKDREDYLLAKAGLEMEIGREADSMQTYQTLLETAPQAIPEEKKLKLALVAQRQGDWERAQSMLTQLWESRDNLKPSLQAEILFWIAEGAQKQGQQVQALRHYLRVYWEFPEEHIWAVTALYRAALIYEQRRDYGVAKKMLTTVVERADRKSQKEAARQRIKGIENRMAESSPRTDQPGYLF